MLAAPKKKFKYSLNPRGNEWSKDESKFGQKLLEKMGWSKGKGLGKNEDGMTDHIRIPYRNDNEGIGYKEKDNVNEFSAAYNEALASLNSCHSNPSTGELETKKKTIIRHRYSKILKAKDASSYSQKDLAIIFSDQKESLDDSRELLLTGDNVDHESEQNGKDDGRHHDVNERKESKKRKKKIKVESSNGKSNSTDSKNNECEMNGSPAGDDEEQLLSGDVDINKPTRDESNSGQTTKKNKRRKFELNGGYDLSEEKMGILEESYERAVDHMTRDDVLSTCSLLDIEGYGHRIQVTKKKMRGKRVK